MTKDAALKLALEVLTLVRQHLERPLGVQMTKQQIVVEVNKVIAAIKEALAQEQNFCPRCGEKREIFHDIHFCLPPKAGVEIYEGNT